MYHPPDLTVGTNTAVDDTRDEYIELCNIGTNTVDLSGWRLKGDSEYIFSNGTTFAAGGYLLLVSFDPTITTNLTAFRTNYNLTAATPVYGPYSEKLANSTFDIDIAYPALIDGYTNYVNVDKVEYRDSSPWPTKADGKGQSLQRASSRVIGNTASNWTGNTPTPGAVNLGMVTNMVIATTSPLTGGVVGSAYTNTFNVIYGSPPYSWAIAIGSVPGLSLDINGVLSGTPTTAGTNTFTVQVTDNMSATASNQFTIIIAATAPGITTASPLHDGTVGIAYSQTLAATGGTMPCTWALSDGTLPDGVTLNSAGVISGSPTNSGTFSFTVQLTDYAGLTTTKVFAIYIPVPTLALTSVSPMVNAQQNSPYSQALAAVGGVTPYSWSIASGALPTGLTLDSLGDITGTPTALGTFNFAACVTDSASNTVTGTLAITVISPALTVATAQLPDGNVGTNYSAMLSATGGTTPYTWSTTWGTLPPGLNLTSAGVVSGTPTNGGTFSFIVQVADSASTNAQQLFTVAIQNNAPVISVQGCTNGVIQLLISGDGGADYSIEFSTNLMDWETVFMTNAPAVPFGWADTNTLNSSSRFYRVWLGQ